MKCLIAAVVVAAGVVLATACAFGIKVHVVSSTPVEVFEACRVGYVWDAFNFSIIPISVFIGCLVCGSVGCALTTLCDDGDSEDDVTDKVLTVLSLLLAIPAASVPWALLYLFVSFGAILLGWVDASDVEEQFIFYPEFYEDNFAACASAENLPVVELAVMLYKIESFALMILLLLICPCGTCYLGYACTQDPL